MEHKIIKTILVDDHRLMLKGIRNALQAEKKIEIKASFDNASDFLEFLENDDAHIVILDVNLPDINGIEVCAELASNYPSLKILGLSNYNDPSLICQMVKNGAKGYLLKDVAPKELISAIVEIDGGNSYFSNEIQRILADSIFDNNHIEKLTRREKEVLKLVADGETTEKIGNRLNISRLTAETHRRNLMRKMGTCNSVGLVKRARELNLL